MQLDIDAATSTIINHLMTSGQYDSPEAVVRDAMQAIHHEAELQGKLKKGLASLDAGHGIHARQVFTNLRKRFNPSKERTLTPT